MPRAAVIAPFMRPWPGRLRVMALDIKLAHSVFALPFAVLGAFLARPTGAPWGRFAGQLALVVACMVFARTWAMLVNRLADARFDAANPRTRHRPLASGALRARDAGRAAAAAAILFACGCAAYWPLFDNPWPAILCAPVLAWIALYSFTKRFTAACHVFLGGALGASPIAAAIAVEPASLAHTPALWLVGAMVVAWVAGFDIIYALQDVDFDRSAGLHSLPARLGPRRAVLVSRALHLLAFGALVAAWAADARLGVLTLGALIPVGALLVAEHVIISRRGLAGLDLAFFTLNGVVSLAVGAAASIDAAW